MLRELRWALVGLRKRPLFALAVLVILALGIGANTAIFSIVDAVLLRPPDFAEVSRMVRIEESSTKVNRNGVSTSDYRILETRADLFEKIAGHLRDEVTIYGEGEPDQVVARRATAGLFPLLGVRARLGRTLGDGDHEALLSDRLWRRRFHEDPGVVGRSLIISDESYTIVGVMPADFEFPYSDVEMWLPLRVTENSPPWLQGVVARLRANVTVSQVQGAMEIMARQREQEDPKRNAGLRVAVTPWRDDIGKKYEQTLVVILGAVGLVLLIACADVSSLLLSRAVERQREMAIRASLGAGSGQLIRQLLAESLVLAAAGSVAGILIAKLTVRLLVRTLAAMPIPLSHLQRANINGRVLAWNAGLCLALAVVFSLAPIAIAFRTDLQDLLRGGQRGGGPKGHTRLFAILIGCETAFAFLLLAGSGLMVRSLIRLEQGDHGMHADHVLTLRVPIGSLTQTRPRGKYETKPKQMAFYRELLERLQKIPSVTAVAVVNNLPLSGVNTAVELAVPGSDSLTVPTRTISSQYFAVMGIPLISGRYFADSDVTGSQPVAILNEYLARQLFPGREAVGQRLPAAGTESPAVIVGVVRNTPQMSYETPPKAELYRPYQQAMFGVFLSTIVVRSAGDPLSLAPALRKEVWAVDPNQPVVKVEMMDEIVANSIWRPRFSAWLFTVLGGLALVLTTAGVYSVVAYTTTLRAKEVGIRVALGATPARVIGTIVRGALVPLVVGVAVSAIAAIFLSRLLASILYETAPNDPATFLGAGLFLVLVGVSASVAPAWRAAGGDPVAALRAE